MSETLIHFDLQTLTMSEYSHQTKRYVDEGMGVTTFDLEPPCCGRVFLRTVGGTRWQSSSVLGF